MSKILKGLHGKASTYIQNYHLTEKQKVFHNI